MRLSLTAGLVGVLCSITAWGQTRADQMPADAIAYVSWTGSQNLPPEYQQSHLKALLDSSDIPALFNDFLPKLIQHVGQKDPGTNEAWDIISAIGSAMWRHPSALYFGGMDLTNPHMPIPNLLLLCDAGADAPAMAAKVQQVLAKFPPGLLPITLTQQDTRIVIRCGNAANLSPTMLSANPAFRSAMSQVQPNALVTAYVDTPAALKLIDRLVQSGQDEQSKARWPIVRDALGLNGIHQLIYTGGLEGKGWTNRAFLAAPAPRTGLACLLDGKPLSDAILSTIPKNVTLASAWQFDLARLTSETRTALGKIDPATQTQFDQLMMMASQMIGLNIQKDLLESLGTEWAYYQSPSVGGTGSMLGLALVNRLQNPKSVERALTVLELLANAALQQHQLNSSPSVKFYQTKIGDLTVHYLGLAIITPAWAIKDGNLYLACYPQVVTAASNHVSTKGDSILDNTDFVSLRAKMGAKSASQIQFADLPQTTPTCYPAMLLLSRLSGIGDMFGIQSPPTLVPPITTLMQHVTPNMAVSWSDEKGYHWQSSGPFPGAELLAMDTSMLALQQNAMLLSILLPSINQARTQANSVKCMSNMRQIGMGILLYAEGHNGQFPPDLGTLAQEGILPAAVFICSDSTTTIPAEFPTMTKPQQADWINQNSSYVYTAQRMKTSNTNSETVIMYEKAGNHPSGKTHLLFADGHVEARVNKQ